MAQKCLFIAISFYRNIVCKNIVCGVEIRANKIKIVLTTLVIRGFVIRYPRLANWVQNLISVDISVIRGFWSFLSQKGPKKPKPVIQQKLWHKEMIGYFHFIRSADTKTLN